MAAVHRLGYIMALVLMLLYMWMFIVIGTKLRPRLEPRSRLLLAARLLLAVAYSVSLLCRAGAALSAGLLDLSTPPVVQKSVLDPNVENATTHIDIDVSADADAFDGAQNRTSLLVQSGIEWWMLGLLCLFVLSFAAELDGFDVKTVGKRILAEQELHTARERAGAGAAQPSRQARRASPHTRAKRGHSRE